MYLVEKKRKEVKINIRKILSKFLKAIKMCIKSKNILTSTTCKNIGPDVHFYGLIKGHHHKQLHIIFLHNSRALLLITKQGKTSVITKNSIP